MKTLVFLAPINSLSFGNVAFNFLREFYKKNINIIFYPKAGQLSLDAYQGSLTAEMRNWLSSCYENRQDAVKKNFPTLQLWHINGSDERITPNQFLYTFYELNKPTYTEKNLVNLQNHTFFSSNYATNTFRDVGSKNISYVPIGFDSDFQVKDKKYLDDCIHFLIMGKFEKRKHTEKIIKTWAKKYGNNHKYKLTCAIVNPHLPQNKMLGIISTLLERKHYGNISFMPYLTTNAEVNDLMNSADIDLTGMSGAEGWNLPAFNMTAIGKWSIVLNATSHKDWATSENSILIEPKGMETAVDDVFFRKEDRFNIGDIYSLSEEQIIEGFEKAEKLAKTQNAEGIKLQTTHTYDQTVSSVLKTIFES
jgi:glycosyltransferase involved in cell wall biosynthesis